MNISEILKQLRIDSGLTQSQLAKKLNIGQSTIVGYEKGEREPTITNISRYAEFFEVSIDYLVGLEDDFGVKKIDSAKALPTYTAEEQQLIEDYRSLTPPLQKMIKETIKTFKTSKENLRNKGVNNG